MGEEEEGQWARKVMEDRIEQRKWHEKTVEERRGRVILVVHYSQCTTLINSFNLHEILMR